MSNKANIEKLESALGRLESSESVVYFLTYDTKGNARASIKYIYDLAKTLNDNGTPAKILVEDKNYTGVESWLGDGYKNLDVVTIKDDFTRTAGRVNTLQANEANTRDDAKLDEFTIRGNKAGIYRQRNRSIYIDGIEHVGKGA